MTDSLQHLTQVELLQLGLGAMRRDEDARAIVYLKEAADRADVTARVLFLLGSLYAQIGLIDLAIEVMSRAVGLDAQFIVARFQLGMLHLTSGQATAALAVWSPLAGLGEDSPFCAWRQGLEYMIRDDFDAALPLLRQGITLNTENEALNADIRRLIDRIEQHRLAGNAHGDLGTQPIVAVQDDGVSHLFLSIYNKGRAH